MKAYERLLKYVQIPSASDPNSDTTPSTKETWDMAQLLKEEMQQIGLTEIELDEKCYLYATIPSNIENYKGATIGFIAHMDVSPDSPCKNIKPQIIKNYNGKDIKLNEQTNFTIPATSNPYLAECIGHDLIVTDGNTLLGADDKAGIAEILTMAETLINNDQIKHGKIRIAFTPDEEIGRGADHFDVEKFAAQYAFTVDGGAFGEISYENFNAYSVKAHFTGISVHPGSAKNTLINSQLLAIEYFSMLPEQERPETTEEREGFYLLTDSYGTIEQSTQEYILRDHDYNKVQQKIETMKNNAEKINEKYGQGSVTLEITESYLNMAEEILKYPSLIQIAKNATQKAGATPKITPIRGGTDGARLSFMGLPCPNLGTASGNHHGRMEFASVQGMGAVVALLVALASEISEYKRH